ncbi:MAG TPA: UvrD-helicase domain-containing protein [Bdellovibrionales bacterium]|nr:UvrD-helicase domain-containing protein [Bdellovibrionales bacterium]
MSNTTPELRKHEIVRAGAGAGKTYTLTHRVTDIAEAVRQAEGRWPRIVVTTFTRKATQELRERLMLLALKEKPELADFVNSRSNLAVSTIHGVLDLYLKRYGARLGLDPSYKVIGPAQALKLAKQVMRDVLFETKGDDLLETIAFTRLVSIARFLDGVWSQDPNATPFTEADMRRTFERMTGELANRAARVGKRLSNESEHKGWAELGERFDVFAKILSSNDWEGRRSSFELTLDFRMPSKTAKGAPDLDLAEEAAALKKDFQDLLDEKFDPALWRSHAQTFARIEIVARKFSETFRLLKRQNGFMEISDQENLAMECARLYPETATSFSQDWDHWLIDEYQDTSPFQVDLIRMLMGDRPGFIVGDPQQSIYLFRGARSEVFAEKEDEIQKSGGQRRLLTVNRRSRPEFLYFVNDFFSMTEPPFTKMDPFLENKSVDNSITVANVFAAPEPSEDDDRDFEIDTIVAQVQELLKNGSRPDEIAILGRTNKTLSEVAEALDRHRVPVHVHSSGEFFDRREIRDAIALYKFLVNPHDGFNLIEVLRSPWFKVSDDILGEASRVKGASRWTTLVVRADSDTKGFEAILRLREAIEDTTKLGLSAAFKKALIAAGFIDLSHHHDASGRRESNLWKFISQLESEEVRPGFNPLGFVTSALTELKIDVPNSEGDAVAAVEPDRVNLMTIHSSKGLEFKHVFLPRMHEKPRLTTYQDHVFDREQGKWCLRVPFGEDAKAFGSPPEEQFVRRLQEQEILEHARVLYVALTRGIDSVFLSWTGEPERHSFAEMAKLVRLEAGEHQRENYRISVLAEPLQPKLPKTKIETDLEPRAPWMDLKSAASRAASNSVTELLDAGMQASNKETRDVKTRLRVASTGTNVHRLMELLKYPSQDRLRDLVRRWFPGQEEKVLAAVEFVRDTKTPPLLEVIHAGFVEWGFILHDDGRVIEGQVDLWGRAPSGEVWIVDYKTGSPEMKDKAFDQMALYAMALRKSKLVKDDEPIHLAAVFPFAEKIFTAHAPTNSEIRTKFSS